MFIDSRAHGHDKFRPYTIIGAIAYAVETAISLGSITVDGIIDFKGELIEIEKTRMGINKIQKILGVKCVTRIKDNKLTITIV